MMKSGVEGDYLASVEAVTDSIHKFQIYGASSNTYSNTYSNNHDSCPYPTLEMRQRAYDKDTVSSSNTDEEKMNSTD